MPVSDSNKVIFVHIPKNAGTSITEQLDMNKDIGHHLWNFYYNRYPQKWKDYKKFCIVRNPWDRVVSCYEYAKLEESYWHSSKGKSKEGKHLDYDLLHNKSFDECVSILKNTPHLLRHQGWNSQHQYVLYNNNIVVDNVIKLENLNEGLKELLPTINEVKHINKSDRKPYKEYYNDETRDIISQIYKKDIELFNYEF